LRGNGYTGDEKLRSPTGQPGHPEASNNGQPLVPPSQPEGTKGRGSTVRAQGPGHPSGAGVPLRNTTAASQGAAIREMEQSTSSHFLSDCSFSLLSHAGNAPTGSGVHSSAKQSQTKKGI